MSVRFKDRLGRDITCLLLQVYYLYVYIYSPPRLNKTIPPYSAIPLSLYPSTEAAEDVGEELLGETVHGDRACVRVRPGLLVCGVVFGLGQVS
jgi:hypothetical protein